MPTNTFQYCGLDVALEVLSGKWKPIILYHLFRNDAIRFTELWRSIPKVTKKVLLEQLKQLENDALIIREETPAFPPEVRYRISEKGRAMGPALEALEQWANTHATGAVEKMKGQKRLLIQAGTLPTEAH
ncbi:DNA-binding HxlR family transcriptional regulator [Filimonas zeae]|uniref:HTH hxlR-type domain-containing protein n=1 Tax=Filimonas zeae TaxID=1737353 RepID=A0A917J3M0_9BACT|nr:helix-turn-helix domain-containing protein [Filimonas zeae]MDR6340939.1 DNA-binding HxlR family transcriptional regulator [Filimonas zeae]GGH77866.1 hypothetical protein GCM10011379_44860 [Filimonas zeae]